MTKRVIEGEVISVEEVQAAEQQAQLLAMAPAALGALAGELLARALGGNPKVGRRLGAVLSSPKARAELAKMSANLYASVKRVTSKKGK